MIRSLQNKGFFHLLSVNFLTQFLGFGSGLLVAKLLNPVELGQIKILQSYATLFILLGGFGLNTAVLKTCSDKSNEEDRESILNLALRRSLISITVTLGLLASLAFTGVLTPSPYVSKWLIVYAAIIPFAVLTDILIVFLQALKKIKEMARAQALIKLQSFFIIVLSTWLWGFPGFIFANIAAYIAGLVPLLRQVKLRLFKAIYSPAPPGFFRIALFSMLGNGVARLGQYTDILMLDHLAINREEIGYYSLATMFVLAAGQVTATVQSIATPYFSERSKDEAWFRRHLILNQARMAALSVALAVAVYLLAAILVTVVYGPAYQSTLTYLAILLLKYVLASSCALIGVAMLGLGLVHYNFAVVAVTTPMGLIVSYVLLQYLGIAGVAWAQVSAALVTLIMMLWLSRLALRRSFGTTPSS